MHFYALQRKEDSAEQCTDIFEPNEVYIKTCCVTSEKETYYGRFVS